MMRILAALAGALVLFGCDTQPAGAQDSRSLTDEQRDEVRALVRTYLVENPEVIEEALIELQRRARDRERQMRESAIAANAAAVYDDPRDPGFGPEDAPITIVEFMDYKCGYCRIASQWVQAVRASHGDQVRFVMKEFPILGAESVESARAALAASRQGEDVYERFHTALMDATGSLSSSRIDDLASEAGVDIDQMRADMTDMGIDLHLEDVRILARALGVEGTPFFIIHGRVVPAANEQALQAALDQALATVEG